MWLVGYGLLGSLSECLCSVLFDLNCLLGLVLGCLYCLWWVSAMVCIEVSSQYCVVCVQYVCHTVCYVFLRVGMIGVCSVTWRYVYIENIEMFVVG